MNPCKPNTCLNWTNSSVPKRFGLDKFDCMKQVDIFLSRSHCGCDRMIVGFLTTYAPFLSFYIIYIPTKFLLAIDATLSILDRDNLSDSSESSLFLICCGTAVRSRYGTSCQNIVYYMSNKQPIILNYNLKINCITIFF